MLGFKAGYLTKESMTGLRHASSAVLNYSNAQVRSSKEVLEDEDEDEDENAPERE